MCRRSRAKMDQALPPLFVPAGQRSYVDYCAEGGRSLGTRLWKSAYMQKLELWLVRFVFSKEEDEESVKTCISYIV